MKSLIATHLCQLGKVGSYLLYSGRLLRERICSCTYSLPGNGTIRKCSFVIHGILLVSCIRSDVSSKARSAQCPYQRIRQGKERTAASDKPSPIAVRWKAVRAAVLSKVQCWRLLSNPQAPSLWGNYAP